MNYLIEKIWSRPRGVVNASYKNVNDFESSSEKECAKMDKENEKIYSKLLTQAEKAHNAIRYSGLSMNLEVPIPPRPSNRDRYLLWKRRNISKKVIEQTEAVLFLESKGYKYNEHYEAYQAVDLAIEIKKTNGEPIEFVDTSKNFDNVYNKNDKNIFRRRSMYRLRENQRLPQDLQNQNRDKSLNSNSNSKIVINEEFVPSQNFESSNQQRNNLAMVDTSQQPDPYLQQLNLLQQSSTDYSRENSQELILPRCPSAPTAPPAPQSKNVCQRITEINTKINSNDCIPNFSRIESQNRLINEIKPSAPPASINQGLRRNKSTFGFE